MRRAAPVQDTGRGVDPCELPMLFVRFYQAPSRHSTSQAGLGLGLSLAKYLADLHGGSIQAHSDGLGSGTTLVVTLPLLAESARAGSDEGRSHRRDVDGPGPGG